MERVHKFAYMRIRKYNWQETALNKYAKEQGIKYLLTFREDVSGNHFNDRKQWNSLECLLQLGDTIVFKDISRFTGKAENGYKKNFFGKYCKAITHR